MLIGDFCDSSFTNLAPAGSKNSITLGAIGVSFGCSREALLNQSETLHNFKNSTPDTVYFLNNSGVVSLCSQANTQTYTDMINSAEREADSELQLSSEFVTVTATEENIRSSGSALYCTIPLNSSDGGVHSNLHSSSFTQEDCNVRRIYSSTSLVYSLHSAKISDASLNFENFSISSSTSTTKTDLSLNIDKFGFVLDSHQNTTPSGSSSEVKNELKSIRKWERLLKRMQQTPPAKWMFKTKLKHRLFKTGVPDTVRKSVWLQLVSPAKWPPEKGYDVDEFYGTICGFERQIDVDIVRTLRDHILFKERYCVGQLKLFRILVAFANLYPTIGYCQGMSTVVGTLLIYFDERTAFNVFILLFNKRSLAELYCAGFPKLFELFYIQESLMEKFVPKIVRHFAKHQIDSNLYATKWYLSLFLCFPHAICMRLWDLYFYFGMDVFPCFVISVLKILSGNFFCRIIFFLHD